MTFPARSLLAAALLLPALALAHVAPGGTDGLYVTAAGQIGKASGEALKKDLSEAAAEYSCVLEDWDLCK